MKGTAERGSGSADSDRFGGGGSKMSPKSYRSLALALVLLGVLAAGCRKKESDESPSAASALPSAAQQMAPEAPYVSITGNTVLLDGAVVDTTRVIEDMSRMQKLEGLHDALKAKREARRAAKPSSPFAAQVIVECPAETTALVFKSVFLTMVYAGYPHAVVRTSPSTFVAVEGRLPSVPIFGEQPPDQWVEVNAQDAEVVVVRRQGAAVAAQWSVPHDQRETLASKMVDELRRQPLTGPERNLGLHADNRLPFGKLGAVLDGLHAARSQLPARSSGRPAFEILLSGS
jgi:hypothetical protein